MLNKSAIQPHDPHTPISIAPTSYARDPFPRPNVRLPSAARLSKLQADLAWHGGQQPLESWHFTTALRCGRRTYSFRVHLLILSPLGSEPEASVSLCLLEQETGWVREIEKVLPLKDIWICKRELNISAGPLSLKSDGRSISIVADLPDAYVELSGMAINPALVCNGEGEISFLGATHHKFSYPSISVSGAVTLMGKERTVAGSMWFNRQWGEMPRRFTLERNLEQRQWISLYPQLSNGISLSVTQLWDFERDTVETNCTALLPDGTHIVEKIDPLDFTDYVESRLSGRRYPRQVELKHEAFDTHLHISLPYKKREVVSKIGNMIRFDGKMACNGMIYGEEVSGDGFVEMVGRWR